MKNAKTTALALLLTVSIALPVAAGGSKMFRRRKIKIFLG